jgi:glycosyltransferase involved in cell wall biosynthesis
MNKELKITCVCVTKSGRTSFLKKSIEYFQNQTYTNKELLILSQATQEENKQIEQFISNSQEINLHIVDEKMDLGTMRHTSVSLAKGDIVCQWDDDDVFGKNRLSNQYNKLTSDKNNIASAYSSFLHYFKCDRKIYLTDWSQKNKALDQKFHQGTIMFYRDAYCDRVSYSPAENCEDWDFAKKIVLEGNIGLINQLGDFIYVHHGGNTMELSYHKAAVNWNFKGDEETLIQNKDNIEDVLNLLKEDFPISIVSNNEEIILTKN